MQENLQEIIQHIRKGDQKAFRELVEYYQHPAFVLVFRILGDEEEAKDAVQEGFIKIWKHIESYKPANKFTSWMFRIMANCAIDRVRKIRRRNEVTMEENTEQLQKISHSGPDVTMDNKEMGRIIRMLANGLPEKQQLVFILRDIQGMESSEVQALLGISETRVKSNLHHARKSMREKIERIYYFERS